MERDWEACMTFNGLSWGYVDSAQAKPYSYNAQGIIKMLNTVCAGGGNLLLNIGPTPDGDIPEEVVEPLETVGKWLQENGEAVYGAMTPVGRGKPNGAGGVSQAGTLVYFWCRIWPRDGEMGLGGFMTRLKSVKILRSGTPVDFEQRGQRILLRNLPTDAPDGIAGVSVLVLEFDEPVKFVRCSAYPQLHGGKDLSDEF
jgi:alpha-L-fucosidase